MTISYDEQQELANMSIDELIENMDCYYEGPEEEERADLLFIGFLPEEK